MRRLVFLLLRATLVPALVRETLQRRRATILLWHDPDPETFERHVRLLRRLYTPIPLRQLVEALRDGRMRSLPPKPLVFTLDDGHRGNARLLPVLERHRVPVTVFLCSGIVGTERPFPFSLGRRHRSGSGQAGAGRDLALSDEDVERMRTAVDFQSHTATHARLPFCSEAVARREIAGSKRELEERYGLQVYALAYPSGDYSDRDAVLAREAGYLCALTADPGFNSPGTDLYRLRRLSVDDADGLSELVVKASGVWGLLRQALRGRPYGYRASAGRHCRSRSVSLGRAVQVARTEGMLSLGHRLLRRALSPVFQELVLFVRDLREPESELSPVPPVEVRLLRPEEAGLLAELHPALTQAVVRQRLEAGAACVTAWRDGRPVGVAWVKFGEVDMLGRPFLLAPDEALGWWVYTHPSARGQGVATAMLVYRIRFLREAGYRRLIAFVAPENRPGFGPVRRAGYRAIGRVGVVRLGSWERHFLRPEGGRRRWARRAEPIVPGRDLPG